MVTSCISGATLMSGAYCRLAPFGGVRFRRKTFPRPFQNTAVRSLNDPDRLIVPVSR